MLYHGTRAFPELGVMGASVATDRTRYRSSVCLVPAFPWQRSGQAESFASQSEHERDGHFGEAVFERHVSGLHRHGELDRLDEDSFKLRQHGDRGIHDRHPNHLVRALSFFWNEQCGPRPWSGKLSALENLIARKKPCG